MKLYQYDLSSGITRLTCWLPADKKLKPGLLLTLKQIPEMVWQIRAVYGPEMDFQPDIEWKVGGIRKR